MMVRKYDGLDVLLLGSFFISGCSALIYQVCWQRALYGVIGVDIDSITIIVSVFMLGIGMGGMAGGWLADRRPACRLRWYAGAVVHCALWRLFAGTAGVAWGIHHPYRGRRRCQRIGLPVFSDGAYDIDGDDLAVADDGFQ